MVINRLNPVNPTMIDLFTTPIAVCFITKPPINTPEIDKYSTGNFLKCQTLVRNFMIGEKSIKVEKTLENLQWKQFSMAVGDGSTGGSQFQLAFTEDQEATVTNTFLLLHKYMVNVITGGDKYSPKDSDIANNVIDYAMSMYVLLLKPNCREVINFCKVQNMILSSASMETFSFDRTVIDAKYPSISFITDTTKLNDEYVLFELADLLGVSNGSIFGKENGKYVLSEDLQMEIIRYIGNDELNAIDATKTTNTLQSNIMDINSGNSFINGQMKSFSPTSLFSALNIQENMTGLAKNILGDPYYKTADAIIDKLPTYSNKLLKYL